MSEQNNTTQSQSPNVQVHFGNRGGHHNIGKEIEKPKDAKNTLTRLLIYFKNEKKILLLLIVFVIIMSVTSLIAPSLQGTSIDLIVKMNWQSLWKIIIALAVVYLIQVGCTLANALLSANLSQHIVKKMRHDLFKKISNLSIGYLDTHSNGDIMSRMTNDIENISSTISQSMSSIISGILTIIGTIAVMFWYCWQLTLITLTTVIMTIVVTKKLSKIMRQIYRKRSKITGLLNGHTEEMISGYHSIVAYNKQTDVISEFDNMSETLKKVGIKSETLAGSMGPIMNTISNISFVIVAAFGGYFALSGLITIGTISAFIVYAKQFSRPVNDIAQLYGTIQTAIASAERVFELLDQPDENKSGNKKMDNTKGHISFKNVNFSYLPGKQVLYDFSLDIKPGQKIALVGATGSGKTTVVNLLMRFYSIDSGEILIDGIDITDISRDELRHNIAIVLQDTMLFSDTIGRNIKYSDQSASDEEMIKAAKMSNCSYFIDKLPDHYNTYLKQAGQSLSQGQRQLLNIARAILANPKILILDEATSSVDTRTEKHIQDAMVKLMENRTSLIIAHRLSTIQDANIIVVMDNGRIIETGTHDQLLSQKGKYYALYMTQFEGNQI